MSRVLVIDDDPATVMGFSGVLRHAGFDVVTAPTSHDGFVLAHRERLDLILSDLRLPDGSGVDLLRQLRAERIHVPFVIVTGFGTTGTAVEAGRLGAVDYVEKPLIGDELVGVVERALAGKRDEAPENSTFSGECQQISVFVDPLALQDPESSRPLASGGSGGTYDVRVAQAINEISNRYADSRLRLSAIARQVGISASRLTQLFRRDTGRTFGAHLHSRRVSEAARLLAHIDSSVKEIAWRVGYARTSELDWHFAREFRLTPSEYRRTSRRHHP